MFKKTKIIGTIGPASSNKDVLRELIKNGLDVIRLNMSHGSYEEQMEKVNAVRELNVELGTTVAILLDTKGPEVRTGEFEDDVVFEKGSKVTITMDEIVGTSERFTVSYKGLANDLKVGDIVLLDDGYVSVEVIDIANNELICKVLNTGKMKSRRGVNVPGVTLNFEFMSEKDKADILFASENKFDFIAASFVRNAKDLKEIRDVLDSVNDNHVQIISKIESQDGVDHINEIIEGSDGIMVARGDLGVEIPAEDVPAIQKMIIKKCNRAGKIVITATQMLESMQSNPRPTRAEVSDVFNAVIDGSDAVMLSGESAAGQYPVESVAMQALIASRAEEAIDYKTFIKQQGKSTEKTVANLVAYSAVSVADELDNVKLIIAITESGSTARAISRLRPRTPILAITFEEEVMRRLVLNFGVYTSKMEKTTHLNDLLQGAIEVAVEKGFVKAGDEVAISAGSINGEGNTDLMKIMEVK